MAYKLEIIFTDLNNGFFLFLKFDFNNVYLYIQLNILDLLINYLKFIQNVIRHTTHLYFVLRYFIS